MMMHLCDALENALQPPRPRETAAAAALTGGQPVDIDCEMGQVDIKPKEELSQK